MAEKILSAAGIKTKAEYRKPGRYADGAGLYLQVTAKPGKQPSAKGQWDRANLTRAWLFQFSWLGRVRQMGLGSADVVTLAKARERAKEAREKVADGIDPIAQKKAARKLALARARIVPGMASSNGLAAGSFEACAADYIATHSTKWRSEVHRNQWTSSLKTYAHPFIGKMHVADIQTSDIMRVLEPIWATKLETADRVRGRIEKILYAAKVHNLRTGDNPAVWKNHLSHLLPSKSKSELEEDESHHPAMPYADLPAFVCDLAKRPGIAARALELLILTVARTSQLISMQDRELDLRKDRIWTIPGRRMKGGKEHVVPLPDRALEILATIPREKGNGFVFMGAKPNTHLSNMGMLMLMRAVQPAYVPHGFRSSFNDWAFEMTEARHEVIEKCMAHKIKSKTERAYRRGELIQKRRELMDEWASYLYGGKS
jgi:integrase